MRFLIATTLLIPMPAVKSFNKAEEAHICAAYLMNEGVDAMVIDESGIGGNALGAVTGSIRIEVPESQETEAVTLLEGYEPSPGSDSFGETN